MSFNSSKQGVCYAPGFFIANNDENVVRVTYEFKQDDPNVVTREDGAKYVPMASVITDEDSAIVGLAYEDIDVSEGNMPGSVVVANACIYEDMVPAHAEYDEVTPVGTENPKEEGWYEKVGTEYVLSTDTTVDEDKTYYEQEMVHLNESQKTALTAKGFSFAVEPSVTRPY